VKSRHEPREMTSKPHKTVSVLLLQASRELQTNKQPKLINRDNNSVKQGCIRLRTFDALQCTENVVSYSYTLNKPYIERIHQR